MLIRKPEWNATPGVFDRSADEISGFGAKRGLGATDLPLRKQDRHVHLGFATARKRKTGMSMPVL